MRRANGVASPVLRYVLRHHRRDLSAAGLALQSMVKSHLPGDDFSLSQWQLGLDYYRGRLAELGIRGKVLLDIGCGSGNWTAAAADLFSVVVGCEIGSARLACARHILSYLPMQNAHLCRADATRLPIASGVVDGALVYNVLPYVKGWQQVLPELARVIKPGGKVLVSWVDVGMMLFCLAEGLLGIKMNRLLDALHIAAKYMGAAASARVNTAAPLTLTKHAVTEGFARAKFQLLHSTWDKRTGAFGGPLFPKRFLALPFFYEALFEREG